MSYSAFCAFALAVTGCASAGVGLESDAGNGGGGDRTDGGSNPIPNVDAAPPIDAPPPVDAPPGCNPMTTELLVNGNFDASPMGMGWTATPIKAMYPIVTADSPLKETSPNIAWLGGLEASPNTDELHQDVMVPAGTTMLSITGYYQIRSGDIPFLPIDYIDVQLTTPTGTMLESVLALDNTETTSQWTPISKTFAMPYAGQTVRLHVTTDSDDTDATSFFLDSMHLTATKCQ
jgi:hypothetical protein